MTSPARATIADLSRVPRHRRSWGYVYVVTDTRENCKIGVTINPNDRLSSLKHATTEPLTMHFKVRVAGAYAIERAAHRLIWDFRVRGEWFRCPAAMAVTAIRAACGEQQALAILPLMLAFASVGPDDVMKTYKAVYEQDQDAAVELDPYFAGILRMKEPKKRSLIHAR